MWVLYRDVLVKVVWYSDGCYLCLCVFFFCVNLKLYLVVLNWFWNNPKYQLSVSNPRTEMEGKMFMFSLPATSNCQQKEFKIRKLVYFLVLFSVTEIKKSHENPPNLPCVSASLKGAVHSKKNWEFESWSPHQHADGKSGEVSGVVFEAKCLEVQRSQTDLKRCYLHLWRVVSSHS